MGFGIRCLESSRENHWYIVTVVTHRWQPRAGRGKEGSEDFFLMDKESL